MYKGRPRLEAGSKRGRKEIEARASIFENTLILYCVYAHVQQNDIQGA